MNTQKIKVKKMGMAEVGNHHPLRLSYLRNKPTEEETPKDNKKSNKMSKAQKRHMRKSK